MNQALDSTRQTTSAITTQGIHHLGLTVEDIHKTANFFQKQLGFTVVGEVPDYPAIFLSDGTTMLTFWQALEPASAMPFDRHHNIGLHHFALAVKDADTLEKLHWQLSDLDDVAIEFSPEALGQSNSRHMICTIPGGLRVEFFAAG
ncbi:VOC family protein [Porticoccus sp.]